jgi:hypothetical protein
MKGNAIARGPVAWCQICKKKFTGFTDEDLMHHVIMDHPAELLLSGAKKLLERNDLLGAIQEAGAAAAKAIFKR